MSCGCEGGLVQVKPSAEDKGVITKQFLKKLCRSDFKQYYTTPYLNDILYLHYKGFEKMANLEEFTGLKVLYLQGNAIRKIEGLELLVNLRCLYMHENLLRSIEGLDSLTELVNLNLSDNMIEKVSGLSKLAKLSNLQLKRNQIGVNGLQDVMGLLQCPSVSCLDVSDNKIQEQQFLPEVLMKMPNMAVVYLQNNEFTKKISHYRKTIITKIPNIKYIDDKPVFEDEKRFAEAWARGGLEEERKERERYRKEKQEEQRRQHEQFRQMIERAREEGRKQREKAQSSESESEVRSGGESLQTYNSPAESHENSEKSSVKQQSDVSREPSEKEKSVSQNHSQRAESEHGEPKKQAIVSNDLDELD